MAIETPHYEQNRQALMADPIVIGMADELPISALADHTHPDGSPRFQFMQAANAEYRSRGGTIDAHIGAVAQAVLRLKKHNVGRAR